MLWSTSQYWITGCTEGVKIMDTWEYLGNNNQPFRDRKKHYNKDLTLYWGTIF